MKKINFALVLVAFFCFEAYSANNLWFNGNVHYEKRGTSSTSYDLAAGVDFVIAPQSQIWAGLYLGIFDEEEFSAKLGGSLKVLAGIQAYKYFDLNPQLGFKAGLKLDFLKGDSKDPVYFLGNLYLGAEYKIAHNLGIEALGQLGVAPFFNPKAYIYRFGLGVNYSL